MSYFEWIQRVSIKRRTFLFLGSFTEINKTTSKKSNGRNGINGSYRPKHELDAQGLVPLPAKTCFYCRRSCRRAPLIACDYCSLYFHQVKPPDFVICNPNQSFIQSYCFITGLLGSAIDSFADWIMDVSASSRTIYSKQQNITKRNPVLLYSCHYRTGSW